jgi:hypothetical protein
MVFPLEFPHFNWLDFFNLRKSRSSPLNHIFSTIRAFPPHSTQNWVCTRSSPHEWLPKKFTFALKAPFPNSQLSKFCSKTKGFAKNCGNSGFSHLEKEPANSYINKEIKNMAGGSVTVMKLIVILSVVGAWLFVNIYVFPKLGIRT